MPALDRVVNAYDGAEDVPPELNMPSPAVSCCVTVADVGESVICSIPRTLRPRTSLGVIYIPALARLANE